MALIVYPAEGYDSFVSLAAADAYHASMGNDAWAAATVGNREAALRRGTQYVYAKRLLPEALDPLHPNVAAAAAEAAQRQLEGKLYRDIEQTSGSVIEKTVGPLTLRFSPASEAKPIRIPVIDDLLFGLTSSGLGFGRIALERA